MMIKPTDIRDFLEEKADLYNRPEFIDDDPISVPHLFSQQYDIEIAGFLTATIAWGNRVAIIKNATSLMRSMDFTPFEFVMNASEHELKQILKFVHRTFNGSDCLFFLQSLRHIYQNNGGLEDVFTRPALQGGTVRDSLMRFRTVFFEQHHPAHARKHVADVKKNASAKRLNMFLRWMVRRDSRKVDFGIWKKIDPSQLYCPLDVHSGRVARSLGLLKRKSNDWNAVEELTLKLRLYDPSDPVKYDYALFGLGVHEKF